MIVIVLAYVLGEGVLLSERLKPLRIVIFFFGEGRGYIFGRIIFGIFRKLRVSMK